MELRVISASGFKHLWLKSVTGFDPKVHCARCLLGKFDRRIRPKMTAPATLELDTGLASFFYLCGVAEPFAWANNLHLAVRHEVGSTASVVSYNGLTFTFTDARALPIPPLPDGWHGYAKSFTTCRNFQFGWSYQAQLQPMQGEMF